MTFVTIGTSTGSLISFGLVGGNQKDGKRVPMSVQEIIELYKEAIPFIFKRKKSWSEWGSSWVDLNSWKGSVSDWKDRLSGNPPKETNGWLYTVFGYKTKIGKYPPSTPYVRKSFEQAMEKQFGNTTTDEIHYNGCIAGAVAREFNENIDNPDIMTLFDSSKKSTPQLVKEVLLGSSNAPLYFHIPSPIGLKNYIDGGVGGTYWF